MAKTLCMMNVLWEFITTWIMPKCSLSQIHKKAAQLTTKQMTSLRHSVNGRPCALSQSVTLTRGFFSSLTLLWDRPQRKYNVRSSYGTILRNFPILYSWIRATFVLNINCELESLIDELLYIYYYIDIPLYLIVLEYIKFPSCILIELHYCLSVRSVCMIVYICTIVCEDSPDP